MAIKDLTDYFSGVEDLVLAQKEELDKLRPILEAWRQGDVAWDCLAEVAADYYKGYLQDDQKYVYRCGKCHLIRPDHEPGCLVNSAAMALERLKGFGEPRRPEPRLDSDDDGVPD